MVSMSNSTTVGYQYELTVGEMNYEQQKWNQRKTALWGNVMVRVWFIFAMIRCVFVHDLWVRMHRTSSIHFRRCWICFVIAGQLGDCWFPFSHGISVRNRYQVPSLSQHCPWWYGETQGMTITQKRKAQSASQARFGIQYMCVFVGWKVSLDFKSLQVLSETLNFIQQASPV